jgi:hypothetical protein
MRYWVMARRGETGMKQQAFSMTGYFGAPGKAWRFQRVKFPHRQGASHPTGNRALGEWR